MEIEKLIKEMLQYKEYFDGFTLPSPHQMRNELINEIIKTLKEYNETKKGGNILTVDEINNLEIEHNSLADTIECLVCPYCDCVACIIPYHDGTFECETCGEKGRYGAIDIEECILIQEEGKRKG